MDEWCRWQLVEVDTFTWSTAKLKYHLQSILREISYEIFKFKMIKPLQLIKSTRHQSYPFGLPDYFHLKYCQSPFFSEPQHLLSHVCEQPTKALSAVMNMRLCPSHGPRTLIERLPSLVARDCQKLADTLLARTSRARIMHANFVSLPVGADSNEKLEYKCAVGLDWSNLERGFLGSWVPLKMSSFWLGWVKFKVMSWSTSQDC